MAAPLIQFPKSKPLNPDGTFSREWILWFQNPQFLTLSIGTTLGIPSGGTGLSSLPSNGQLLIGNSVSSAYALSTLTPATGIGVTNGAGSITVSNTGVTSNVAGAGIGVSGVTGAVTISNTGVTSITGTTNEIIASGSTGGITLSTPQAIGTGSSPTFNILTIASLIFGSSAFGYTAPTAWTPIDASGASLSLTTGTCQYMKFGKLCVAAFNITYPVTVDASTALIGGLPATSVSGDSVWPVVISVSNLGVGLTARIVSASTTFAFETLAGVEYTNAGLSGKGFRGAAIFATT